MEETMLSDRVRKMEEMAEMEEEYAIAYDKNVMGLGNVAIAELMMSVALDSRKHAGLYRAIATMLKGSLAITDMEYDQLEESLRRHVEVEARMMEEAKALMEGEEDDRVRRLLEEIYADEVRHHKFLSNLLEAVVKRDLIFEGDVWDMIWRDVPTHGAPRDPYA
jgi:rubrerythrin